MKTGISAALLAHYAQGTTSLCTCWKVTRTDEVVLGYTDLDRDVTFEGVTYLASSGFSPSNFESQSRLAVDNLEAVGVLDSESLTVEDLAAGVWDFALVEVFRVNWRDLTMGRDLPMSGRLGAVDQSRNTFKAELRGLTNAYAQTAGSVCQPACRATLGDARCQVNLAPFTVTGTLESVSDDGIVLTDSTRTEPGPAGGKAITGISQATLPVVTCTAHGFVAGQIVYIAGVIGMLAINGQFYVVKTVPNVNSFTLAGVDTTNFVPYASGGTATPQGDAGYFDYGKLTMTTGSSTGLSAEVKAYSPGTITLQLQLPRGAQAGDEYTLVAGCGKRFTEDCVVRFSNGINFRGEPHLPGMDQVLRVGGA
jgi:hypothetical protein